jgi:hypothetical protein
MPDNEEEYGENTSSKGNEDMKDYIKWLRGTADLVAQKRAESQRLKEEKEKQSRLENRLSAETTPEEEELKQTNLVPDTGPCNGKYRNSKGYCGVEGKWCEKEYLSTCDIHYSGLAKCIIPPNKLKEEQAKQYKKSEQPCDGKNSTHKGYCRTNGRDCQNKYLGKPEDAVAGQRKCMYKK